jgi:hypothetical protein
VCRQASRLSAEALSLHGGAAGVQKEGLALQKIVRAAGWTGGTDAAAGALHHCSGGEPSLAFTWATRSSALLAGEGSLSERSAGQDGIVLMHTNLHHTADMGF